LIEFTISRVAVFICGIILLAAVIIPVSGYFERQEDEDMSEAADAISKMIDSFWDSEADTMTLQGQDILPSSEYSIILNGHKVSIMTSDREYTSMISHPSEDIRISYNDIVHLKRSDGYLASTD
jgi:hypothetical protein